MDAVKIGRRQGHAARIFGFLAFLLAGTTC